MLSGNELRLNELRINESEDSGVKNGIIQVFFACHYIVQHYITIIVVAFKKIECSSQEPLFK